MINKEEIKDLIYKVQNEFDNELDYDYDYNGRELTDDDLDMIQNACDNFARKLNLCLDDEIDLTQDKQETMKQVSKLFMEESDRQALELLYEITNDKLVKIALDWNKSYETELNEVNTNEFYMYDDIISYIWDKYKIGAIYETIE